MDQKSYQLLKMQCDLTRRQLFWSRAAAALCLVLVLAAVWGGLYVKIALTNAMEVYDSVADQADEILSTLSDASGRLDDFSKGLNDIDIDRLSASLQSVSRQLSDIQWQSLADNIDSTAITAQQSLQKAMDAVDQLDIRELNEAIEELHTVVEPLADIVKRLR